MGTDSNSIADGASRTQRGMLVPRCAAVHPVWWLNARDLDARRRRSSPAPCRALPPLHEPHIAWWRLALGFLVAERCVVHLQFRRSAHSFSLGDVPLVFGLVFATGDDLVSRAVVGTALTLLLDRRLPPIKLVFNLAQFALAVCLADDHRYCARARRRRDSGPQLGSPSTSPRRSAPLICVA